MQAIIIPDSPEMGSSDQPGPEGVALREPREVTTIPPRTAGDPPSLSGEKPFGHGQPCASRDPEVIATRSDTAEFLSPPSRPGSCDGESDHTRA